LERENSEPPASSTHTPKSLLSHRKLFNSLRTAMQCNVGTVDRWVRLIAGALLFVLGGWSWGGWQGHTGGIIALVVGVVLIATALLRWCPMYSLLRITTAREQARS